MGESAGTSFDVRLIPEFDGSGKQTVVEWLEKAELVCKLRSVEDVAGVIPLRLTGGAFAVYLQMSEADRKVTQKVKDALKTAFAVDPFVAYEQFVSRKLLPGELPDVFLAELRRLAPLFGGMSDKGLACAFVSGLPEGVRQLLRTGSRLEELSLEQILTRARAVMRDDPPLGAAGMEFSVKGSRTEPPPAASPFLCHECGGPNHLARDCLAGLRNRHCSRSDNFQRPTRRDIRCYRCNRLGHIASKCPGNERGEEASAPASSHGRQ